jgi:prepilin-type N-terminal cleavage/methylation domain-containing protein
VIETEIGPNHRGEVKPNFIHSCDQRFRPKGFSLVELLVVILIIVVLAGIGMMMVSRMRKSANQAMTTANLRQISVAMITFTSDNGRFPSRIGDPVWDRAIISNLGFTDPLPGNTGLLKSKHPSLDTPGKIFTTPEDREKRDPLYYPRSFAIVPWTTNWSNGTSFRGWKDRPYNVGVPYSALATPEKSAMVVQWYSGSSSIPNLLGHGDHAYHDIGGPTKAIGSMQQVLFADGHIERLRTNFTNAEFVARYWPGTIGSNN